MITGIVLTHGDIARELLNAAERVYGTFTHCHAFSNSGKAPAALREELEAVVDAAEDEVLVFVDFMGGSCSHACLQLALNHGNVRLVGGVNLPMLLAFLNKREELSLDRLVEAVLERGHNSIQRLDPRNL